MINLNKCSVLAAFFLLSNAYAGKAIIFDDPSLIAFRDNTVLSGFYSQENERFSCQFFFFEEGVGLNKSINSNYSNNKIFTFVPNNDSFLFVKRNKIFDIPGNLYQRKNEWIIKTSSGQAGCENAVGNFTFDPGDSNSVTYTIENEIPAIGIRLVKNKSYYHDYRHKRFIARKGYLTKWNGVVVLEARDQFSFVRFVDPRTNVASQGQITTGWVRSADLVDPFPPPKKQPGELVQ